MKSALKIALVGAALVAVSSPAIAQDYYAREHIEGLKPVATAQNPNPTPSPAPAPSPTPTITYTWQAGDWSDWSSHCSEEAERTRTVRCVGSDRVSASEGMCIGAKPAMSETASVMDQCPPSTPSCEPGIIKSIIGSNGGPSSSGGFSLSSLGVTAETGRTVWLVRNTTGNSNDISFKSGGWSFNFVSLPYSDVYLLSGGTKALGNMIVYDSAGEIVTIQNKNRVSYIYPDCL